MVEPLVVKGCIENERIEIGAQALGKLVEDGLPVHSAAWVYQVESANWRLYVSVPEGRTNRRDEAHRKIFDILYGFFQEDPDLGFQHFTVIEPEDQMAIQFRRVSDRLVKRPGVRYSGPCGRGPFLDDSYVYRLP
jgi:hypothetical protein